MFCSVDSILKFKERPLSRICACCVNWSIVVEFIAEDELLEVTPESIRLRKKELDANKRMAINKKKKNQ